MSPIYTLLPYQPLTPSTILLNFPKKINTKEYLIIHLSALWGKTKFVAEYWYPLVAWKWV